MKLRQRLIEVRAARQRVENARRQSARYTTRVGRQLDTYPLICVGAAAGGGLLTGLVTMRHGKVLSRIWHDPALRWLLHLLLATVSSR